MGSLGCDTFKFCRYFGCFGVLEPRILSKKGSTPTPWARGLRDQIQKWARQTQKTLFFLGFLCSEGGRDHGLRPWSRKGPDHGVGLDPETMKFSICTPPRSAAPNTPLIRAWSLVWKKGQDPHPQDKIQHLVFTKDPRPLYYKNLPCAFYHKMSVVRPFSVLSKDEIGP